MFDLSRAAGLGWHVRRRAVPDERPLDVCKEGVRLEVLRAVGSPQPVLGVPLEQLRDDVLQQDRNSWLQGHRRGLDLGVAIIANNAMP